VLGAAVWYFWIADRNQMPPAGAESERKILYWTDPMVPGFKSDKPGKSPFMDMQLVPIYEDGGDGTSIVTVRPEIVNSLGVRTQQVTRGRPARSLATQGYLFREDAQIAVLVDIFERDAAWVRPGLVAEVRVTDLPGRNWSGTVTAVEPDIDIGTRSLKVQVRLSKPDVNLRPNMFADVTISAPAGRGEQLLVPREAVIRTGTRTAVVLALGEGRFQPVEVVPGTELGDWIEIVKGLNEGDTVVTSGQFLIDSEASVRASFQRIESAPPAAAQPHNGTGNAP
ncbi:MAG: efflux RND transporter periplasmic adaptor subunit, partial [Gammaproteobacteria bacterium]|nr:efflux RND transporter periplasmic adaptor subunit [Gammaproteobacteria bacterium]